MTSSNPKTVHLRLPATSANLGPGFDAMAIAMGFFLEIDATVGPGFSIAAAGRNAEICGALSQNLLIETYESVLVAEGKPVTPLHLQMRNGIPVGMGCGSSAATRLAGVALAAAFGELGWDAARIVEHAIRLEGHPDNVAACWHGGLSIVANTEPMAILSILPPRGWSALVVLPELPLSTTKARSALPLTYSRQDVVANLQSASLLTGAFALGRSDLMRAATMDRLHQPYRASLCPLLPALLPLAGTRGVLSVTLSGAGPSVLLLTERPAEEHLKQGIRELAEAICPVEILATELCGEGAVMNYQASD